jgi:GntR family transcriptional regulator
MQSSLPQLSSDSGVPLYQQLKLWLQDRIRSGDFPQDTPLPSERQLSETLAVSRATIRQAIDALERDGWVTKIHGKGTFVVPIKVEQSLSRLTGFSENMRQAGIKASSKLIKAELAEPTETVAAALGLRPGEVVAVVTRLRLAEKEPLMVERSHLNYALTPKLLEHELKDSLYQLLTETYRLKLFEGEESIEVVHADGWLAKQLKVKKKAPLFYTERLVRDDKGTPIEFVQRYARVDKCRFRVQLKGSNAEFTLR